MKYFMKYYRNIHEGAVIDCREADSPEEAFEEFIGDLRYYPCDEEADGEFSLMYEGLEIDSVEASCEREARRVMLSPTRWLVFDVDDGSRFL
jgi:hypothetical protein